MSVFNSMKLSVLITLLVTGLVIGFLFANAEMFRPLESQAIYERMLQETQFLTEQHNAEIQKQTERNELETAAYAQWLKIIPFLGAFAIVAGVAVTSTLVIMWANSKLVVSEKRIYAPAFVEQPVYQRIERIAPRAVTRAQLQRINSQQNELLDRAIQKRAAAPEYANITREEYMSYSHAE